MAGGMFIPLSSMTTDQIRRYAERKLKEIDQLAKRERLKKEQKQETEEKLKETKPLIYTSKDPEWPIVVVGAGTMWYNDMKEMARRRRESPRYRTDDGGPRVKMPNPFDTLRTAVDMKNRESRGVRTFHIPNNPIGRTYE